uniref:Uncharacterized protein n=1 Tax=Klebsiella pneumoniae TaxID=573 RepID=A0A6G9HZA8_KLEPN|nr:hypothetical protein [Klebsiella pneumoniae]QIQ16167.1 hypothetical protein [Klebsiella pneumoniae]QIQ16403.1 hypothetical protein [Klebsiella pneumoniae]
MLASLKVALSDIQGKESHRYDNFSRFSTKCLQVRGEFIAGMLW